MINMRAPLNTLLGYGHASWGILQELFKRGPVGLYPIGQPHITSGDPRILKLCHELKYDKSAPCLTIWHEFDLIPNFIGKGKHIAFPFFEINHFDKIRLKHLYAADHIIVASKWAREVIYENNISMSVSVAPLGVDSRIFFPQESKNDKYRFFNIGKIEYRKGTYLLPKAFQKAFPKEQDVELYIFADSVLSQTKKQLESFIEDSQKLNDPRIKIMRGGFDKDIDLADFIRSMDCGVFPTRAEGFGLPILQALSCGKPVITTNYSAQTEFCNSDNSHLIKVTDLELAQDGVWFHGLGTWAKIDEDQLVSHMRHCYNKNIRYNQAGIDTAHQFTWSNCVDKILEVI